MELAIAIFECGDRRFEVARICKTGGADGPELRQPKRQTVVFADVSTNLLLAKNNAEFDAARDNADFTRRDIENPEFRVEAKGAELRNNQEFSVGCVKEAILHGSVRRVEMNGDAHLHGWIAV